MPGPDHAASLILRGREQREPFPASNAGSRSAAEGAITRERVNRRRKTFRRKGGRGAGRRGDLHRRACLVCVRFFSFFTSISLAIMPIPPPSHSRGDACFRPPPGRAPRELCNSNASGTPESSDPKSVFDSQPQVLPAPHGGGAAAPVRDWPWMADATRGIGVLLGLLGSIGINVGNNMQALGMGKIERQKRRDSQSRSASPELSRRASSSGEPTAKTGAGASTPAFQLDDESSSSAEGAAPVPPVRALPQPALSGLASSADGEAAAARTPAPRCNAKERRPPSRSPSSPTLRPQGPSPNRPLVRTLSESGRTLVPQLTPSLLSPREMGPRGESCSSLDSVEYAGRIPCVFGGQCIKVTGAVTCPDLA